MYAFVNHNMLSLSLSGSHTQIRTHLLKCVNWFMTSSESMRVCTWSYCVKQELTEAAYKRINTLLKLHYIGVKSIFWFQFFQIERVRRRCPQHAFYVTSGCLGYDKTTLIMKDMKQELWKFSHILMRAHFSFFYHINFESKRFACCLIPISHPLAGAMIKR